MSFLALLQPKVLATELGGFEVDTSQRNEVISFWNRIYSASEGADEVMAWTGNYQTCSPGSTSPRFVEMVERRINFYRALAGIGTNTRTSGLSSVVIRDEDPYKPSATISKQSAAQQTAMMFSWGNVLNHNPSRSLSCWSPSAWNGAARSNLALGFTGPAAMDAYMRENDPETLSVWVPNVGHRRWLLKQGSSEFATGDVPGLSTQLRPVNVLYVIQTPGSELAFTPKFVSWPSEGYFPDALMPNQWSLSFPDADFSSATVSMRDSAGNSILTRLVDRTTVDFGDPTIIWAVPAEVASISVEEDTAYHVTVRDIRIDGELRDHSYQVTVIDPDVINEEMTLTGTSMPPIDGATYLFDPVQGADSHSVMATTVAPTEWSEGAESGTTAEIIDETTSGWPLEVSSPYVRTGSRAFRLRLTPPGPAPTEGFRLDRTIIPGASAQLRYHVRRGYLVSGERLEVQTSGDGNVWTTVDSLAGKGSPDGAFALRTIDLEEGLPVQVRFQLRWVSGSIYDPSDSRVGIFLDDISVTNSVWVTSTTEIQAEEFGDRVRIDPQSLGGPPEEGATRSLRLQAMLGGRTYQSKTPLFVQFTGSVDNYSDWAGAEHPGLIGDFDADDDRDGLSNGIEYAFGLHPHNPEGLRMELTLTRSGPELRTPLDELRPGLNYELLCSSDLENWSSSGTTVTIEDGRLVGRADDNDEQCFLRWRVTQP